MRRPPILVIGSANMDLVLRVARFPRPGETVAGSDLVRAPGGKGANQAVAAARSGARVEMVGAVGADAFGLELRRVLEAEGIGTRRLRIEPSVPTGVALITVDGRGENQIVISPGANARVAPRRVEEALPALRRSRLVLLQREVPEETVAAAVRAAARERVPVVLNPAPAGPVPRAVLERVRVLVVNETEAEALLGARVSGAARAREAARALEARLSGGIAIVTLGPRGAWLHEPDSRSAVHVPAHAVEAVDATAAGDTFVGAFAARYAETEDVLEAARYASAAGALAVTRLGAIPSIPRRRDVARFLALSRRPAT
ncbi:MAG: ribokinase [Planctomycetes bacterium]|nr:ribokinase [Planctomycetota bacterium]